MKMTNMNEVHDFERTVKNCKGDVWAINDKHEYDLKSGVERRIAIGKMLDENASELEIFCARNEDEMNMFDFIAKHPDIN